MASRYRYDDEYETQRPSLLGLLKVIQSHFHRQTDHLKLTFSIRTSP
jgi:hypothetical protein